MTVAMIERIARIVLLTLLGLGLAGVLRPELRPEEQVAHAVAVMALAATIGLSFPGAKLRWIALSLIAATVGVETAQWLGIMTGLAEFRDVVADIIGTAAGSVAAAIVRRSRVPPAADPR
jgi:hypothetical protein